MNFINHLIQMNGLLPADVIILRKKFFGMVNHFAIFLGYDHYRLPIIVANYTSGTKRVSNQELEQFMQQLTPTNIERFQGNNYQRRLAVQRAISKLGENNYNYLENNCEHYANFVQKGKAYSRQADNFKEGSTVLFGASMVVMLLSALLGQGKK